MNVKRDVMNSRQAEREIRNLNQLLDSILENAFDNTWLQVLDENTNVRIWNKAAEAISGYSREEVIGSDKLWKWLYPNEDRRKKIMAKIAAIMKGEVVQDFETEIRRKDGQSRIVHWHSRRILDDDGRSFGSIVLGTDVTERKKIEEALRESEERFRIAAQSASDLVNEWNILTREVNWYGDIDEKLGYAPGEFPRTIEAWEKSLHPDDHDRVMAAVERHLKTGERYCQEYRVRRKDGTFVYWIERGTVLRDEKGTPVRWVGTCTDITDSKLAEQAVQRRLEFEKTISDISSRFVGASDINNAINVSLRDIGRLSGASRAYLFLFSEDMTKMSNTHEWCADGVTPQIGSLKNLPTNTFPWWMEKLRKGEVIRIDDASKMPEEAKAERKTLLEDQNIKSLLVLPLNMQGELMGFIGFDNVTTTGMWRDEDLALLNISSKIIASALSHERIDEEIKSLARFPSENPNPILRLNKDGIIMLANPASRVFLQDWGCKVGDYAPKFWQDLVTETLTNKSRRTIDAELGDRVYLFFVMPVQEANYVNFYGRDITERKRMEEERSRLAAIVDSSDDAIIGKSLDGIIQTWNSGAERLYGYSTDEAIGQNISILTPPELSNEISEILEKIKSGERIKNYETTRISKDGRRIYVSLTISPIIDRSGKIVGASTIARDITNRRQMEEELRRHSEHLEELVENRTEEIKKLNESMSQRLIQKIRQIDNISSLRDEVRKSPDISTALDLILDAVLSDLEMDIGAVLIAKREENVVKLRSFKSRAEGMKVDEEFPLNVGFAEFEALNENKNLSKIVGRDEPTILKTPSVHCAPIHLGNEVYGILACGSRKNLTLDGSDVDVLRLYSDLASTVFETRRLTITPVKEVGSVTEKRFEFEFGCSYLVKNDVQKAFEAFAENVLSGFEGLCITREFPQRVRNKYHLEKTPIVWLTGEKVEGETTINSLQDLSVLIGNFLEKVDQGVVMLDGFEYLITNNGFDSFIRFLQMTRSRFEQRGAVFMAPLLEEALDVKQVKLIEREMKLLMSK